MLPKVIYIETTNICNAHCIMCPHDSMTRKLSVMDSNLFKTIIDGMKECDLSNTQLFLHKEGEPLCDPSIIERIMYTKKNLPSVKEIGINTNAMFLTSDITDRLIDSGLDLIFFSVDGTSADVYDKIRINCSYDVVEKNIDYFLRKRKESKMNMRVVMQMIINDITRPYKDDFIEKWKKYNVEFYLKEMHCYLDGGNSSFSPPDFSKQINCCEDPFKVLVYYVDGKVGSCCWDYNNEFVVGDARLNNLVELFNGDRIQFLRNKQKELSCFDISPCNRCGRIFGEDRISKY